MSRQDEATPLAPGKPWAPSRLVIVAFACLMIPLSVGLISMNKWLMRPDRFPHAIPLVLIHMVVCTVLTLLLRVVKPSFFPSLTDPDTRIEVDRNFILIGVVPIGACFASSLVLSNMAYTYLGVAFIQMIKESNLVWVYVLCVIFAVEKCTLRKCLVVCGVVIGMSLTVKGEMHFRLVGFVLQAMAVLTEATRIFLQGKVLQGKKLDPMTYVMLTAPISALLLIVVLLVITAFPHVGHDLALPHWSELRDWAPWLFCSACLAFCLNLCIASFIKYTGPVSYCMMGLIKDMVQVLVSVSILKEIVSPMQLCGFILEICCVLTWAWLKSEPEKFESGSLLGAKEALKVAKVPAEA
mmetsp:Transcript_129427/g.276059  ORF Transcript_129427/g.276059 Transcript_129427/m.276059 type:complete len:353 (+) Transcript_129427:83-1141(+)